MGMGRDMELDGLCEEAALVAAREASLEARTRLYFVHLELRVQRLETKLKELETWREAVIKAPT
jgi:hypothetical protein